MDGPAEVAAALEVSADLDFRVRVADQEVAGSLRGSGSRLELRVDSPAVFAARADSEAVRGLATALAERGVTVTVVVEDGAVERPLVRLGGPRAGWWQRRLTHSPYISLCGPRAVWPVLRLRRQAPERALLPGPELAPPPTPLPLAPTLLRRRRRPVTTTHDPAGGGDPRLVMAPREDAWPGERQPTFRLDPGTTTLGSADDCDIRLEGLAPHHAEIRHDADDEFVLVALSPTARSRVNGEPVRQRILRTASRVEVGPWTLTYVREEYADHGRPYGGRIGGELGHQRPQPPRPTSQATRPGEQDATNGGPA